VEWLAGEPSRRAELERAIARLEHDDGVAWLRRRDQRRQLARVPLEDGGSCFVKHYLAGERHAWRDAWKSGWARHRAARWRTLMRLRASGIRCRRRSGRAARVRGHVLVTEWIDAPPPKR
jgi:hypothetical protein